MYGDWGSEHMGRGGDCMDYKGEETVCEVYDMFQ